MHASPYAIILCNIVWTRYNFFILSLIFQNYGVIKARIIQQQIEYKKKRVRNHSVLWLKISYNSNLYLEYFMRYSFGSLYP